EPSVFLVRFPGRFGHVFAVLSLNIWLEGKSARRSGGALVLKYFDFAQSACVHVENEAAHGNVFGNPGMRPDFLDLLPGIFLGVLIGEEYPGADQESQVASLD